VRKTIAGIFCSIFFEVGTAAQTGEWYDGDNPGT
jgi:hypothetical protein